MHVFYEKGALCMMISPIGTSEVQRREKGRDLIQS